MTSLQQTAMGGGAATAKTASYVLVAADAGTTVAMNAAGATTITVNTGLFAAGDTVFIQNLGAGACTVTAGTATVATAGSLILPQNDAGILYFTSASAAIFYDYIQAGAVSPLTTKGDLYTFSTSDARLGVGANGTTLVADSSEATGLKWQAPAGGGKVLQVVQGTTTTSTTISTSTMTDTTITATITPTLNTSKILVMANSTVYSGQSASTTYVSTNARLMRDATVLTTFNPFQQIEAASATGYSVINQVSLTYLDSPATTSAITYKVQGSERHATSMIWQQRDSAEPASTGVIILMEIGA